eukprot:scaffold104838_cov60-Phaeocystis_antarctica.AAC.3
MTDPPAGCVSANVHPGTALRKVGLLRVPGGSRTAHCRARTHESGGPGVGAHELRVKAHGRGLRQVPSKPPVQIGAAREHARGLKDSNGGDDANVIRVER